MSTVISSVEYMKNYFSNILYYQCTFKKKKLHFLALLNYFEIGAYTLLLHEM